MKKITFEDFRCIMAYDVSTSPKCIEVEFSVDGCKEYQSAWMGKMLDNNTYEVVYWYGLTEDGSQAFEYATFDRFVNAKIFQQRNLQDIWNSITIHSIDACDVQDRLQFYLGQDTW